MNSYYLILLVFIEVGFSNGLFINEFLARNDLCCEDGNGDNEDFFEIYNNGDTDVDLSGYFVTDDLTDSTKYQLPNGTVIVAGGFLEIWCDSDSNGLHANFNLKGDGEEIGLFDTDTTMIDGFAYDAQCTDVSSVRFPDGSETWNATLSPTPGAANEFNPVPVYNIVINEIFYHGDEDVGYPDSTYEFFELYNNDVSMVDLSGYFLTEGVDFTFPDNSSISSGEYIVVTRDSISYSGNNYQVFQWTNGILDNGGEDIKLMNTDCGVVDYVDYDNSAPWPVEPDGGGPSLELKVIDSDNSQFINWQVSDNIGGTPGASNGGLNTMDNSGLIPNQVSMLLYPNPFNPVTTISFSVPISTNVKIAAYDIVGNQIETILNQTISAGAQSITWNAKNRKSGVYFIRMESGAFVRTQKVILLK